MDKRFHIAPSTPATSNIALFTTTDSIGWLRRPSTGFRMIRDDAFDDDDWVEDDDDLDEDLDEDDDWDDDDDDAFDDEEDEDEIDVESDDFEYEYLHDPTWSTGDDLDVDDFTLLGDRFASLRDDRSSGPRRFRDRDEAPRKDKKSKRARSPRGARRDFDEIDNDFD